MGSFLSDRFERSNYIVWKEGGIVCVYFKKGCIITIDVAKEMVIFRISSFPGESSFLYIMYDIAYLSPEAKEYLAGSEAFAGITKMALLVKSEFSKLVANMFITQNKPLKPTRLFTKKENAIQWLRNGGIYPAAEGGDGDIF